MPLRDDLAKRALRRELKECRQPSCTPFREAIRSRRVREIGVPDTPAPRTVGEIQVPMGVRPAGVPDVEGEKRDALTRLYRKVFRQGKP